MNAHKNLTRLDVVRHGAEKIALMAASEFYRAAKRAHSRESVHASFERGRELMGILETITIPDRVARRLKVIFARASMNQLQADLSPDRIAKIANEIADELERPFRSAAQARDDGHSEWPSPDLSAMMSDQP